MILGLGPFNKKRYFKNMLKDVERVVADLEFKKYAALFEREKYRKQYDRVNELLESTRKKLEGLKGEEHDKVSKEIEKLEEQAKNLEAQITDSDNQIYGIDESGLVAKPEPGMDPPVCLDKKIEHYVEIRELIKVYQKDHIG